jgi:DNA primase
MTEDLIEKIKRNLSTERVISRRASDWSDESGGDRVGRCTHPEHGHTSDKSNAGNLIVTEDEMWYCHSHGSGGDVLDWIAIEEGYATCEDPSVSGEAFTEVLKEAADRAGVEMDTRPSPDDYDEAVEMESLSDEQKARYALDEVVDILHDNLDKVVGGDTVRRVIKDRRPFGDEVIDDLRVGYLDGEAYAEMLRRLSNDALKDIGFMKDDGTQHGTGRIVYPYYSGSLPCFWAGRETPQSEIPAKYLKPHSDSTVFEEPLFEYGTPGSSIGDGVWVTEGIQDAVAVSEHGDVFAVSSVSKDPSGSQRDAIIARAQDEGRAVVCYDADEGGQGGAVSLAIDLMSAGVQTEILSLPDGTDPCDYFLDGGRFADLEPTHAAQRIIEVKGDTDPLLRSLLDTAEEGTPRGERLVDSISQATPIRKDVLRDMMAETREFEQQKGWRQPERVEKTSGVETTFRFVYADGTKIEMDSIASRGATAEFVDKYGAEFNFFPDLNGNDLREKYNEWTDDDAIEIRDIDPLTVEGRVREHVQEQIQRAEAVESKEDLAVVPDNYVAYYREGEMIVRSSTVADWLDDFDVRMNQAADYLEPVKAGRTKPLKVDGKQSRFWVFDTDAITGNGYSLPEPSGTPDDEGADPDGEGVKEL